MQRRLVLVLFLAIGLCLGLATWLQSRYAPTVHIVVTDPHAAPLCCDCIADLGHRRYDRWAKALASELGHPVTLQHVESLYLLDPQTPTPDLIIGPYTSNLEAMQERKWKHRVLALLSDIDGDIIEAGCLITRSNTPVTAITSIAIGFPGDKNQDQSRSLLSTQGLDEVTITLEPSDDAALVPLLDGEVDAAIVTERFLTLAKGCGKYFDGDITIHHRTRGLADVALIASGKLAVHEARTTALQQAVAALNRSFNLADIESAKGFVAGDVTDVKP